MHFNTSGFPPDVEDQWYLTAARFHEWLQNELFSVRWWVLLALCLLFVYLWWKIADKKRLGETALFTASVFIFIIVLDELGDELSLWYYPVDLFPLFPPMWAVDISCLPFIYALLFRITKTWKSFLIASAVMCVIFCFALEPLFVWTDVYRPLAWKSWYGLPLYFAIGVASKFIVRLAFRPAAEKGLT
jgi:hypothetical protein